MKAHRQVHKVFQSGPKWGPTKAKNASQGCTNFSHAADHPPRKILKEP